MSHGTLSGITTALSLIAFLGVAVWAYGARRRATFERAAQIPLEEAPPGEVPFERQGERTP
jgi:cbb3-type cytochrome oxidase subunit 3